MLHLKKYFKCSLCDLVQSQAAPSWSASVIYSYTLVGGRVNSGDRNDWPSRKKMERGGMKNGSAQRERNRGGGGEISPCITCRKYD